MESATDVGARPGLRWCVRRRRPATPLQGHVLGLAGYEERSDGSLRRDELPGPASVLIFELGPSLEVEGLPPPGNGSFLSGPVEMPVRTRHDGFQAGIQVDLSTASLQTLFGVSARELHGRVVRLDELPAARSLRAQIGARASWTERLRTMERWLGRQLERGLRADPRVAYAERRLRESGGQASLSDLRGEVGLSERRFTRLFQSHLGVSPKRFSDLARFDRARRLLQESTLPLAEVALAAGYCDQSHLNREVKRFSRLTPGRLRGGAHEEPVEGAVAGGSDVEA